jgi:hypothetical protein
MKTLQENIERVEFKNKCNVINNRGNWNHLRIIRKTPEQQT